MKTIGILGASGRVGTTIDKILTQEFSKDFEVSAKTSKDSKIEPLFKCDLVIDFSLPEALKNFLEKSKSHDGSLPVLISGTTGIDEKIRKELKAYSEKQTTLWASNFSIGVGLLNWILQKSSPLLIKLGYTPSIKETHHIHKKDKPSGTAITLQESISPKNPSSIPTESIREGEVIGVHQVSFAGDSDLITLEHQAHHRELFARGAIEAGKWALTLKKPGLYTLQDFLESQGCLK